MARMTQRRKIHRFQLNATGTEYAVRFKEDVLAAEEPLEIRIGGQSFAVTMRTPGDDFDLVAGFLVSEGIIRSQSELISLRFCAGEKDGMQTFNVVEAQLGPDVKMPDTMRHVYTSSSCGICGTDSIEAVRKTIHFDPSLDETQVPVDFLAQLPERLREAQAVFDRTGGVHAAGLFKVDGPHPELLCLREDVGRHNAVDKVVGWALRQDLLPLAGLVLQVSGRASFELVQKAALAGIPVLSAVSAPSSLAAQLAAETGVTLVGFSRGQSLNVYAGRERVASPREDLPEAAISA
ncbi:formate dehydrogenase accessory sulfurtransferase FdhD [Paenarthrobacter aurescens]|uniref:formate dehydrogenase accessory sulfurtransferase FdhD n=1 Tax=Paenarthrobacter aurescens TaxID=43663 RepID=UPI0021BFDD82|nr:formate dehydrogenase accessory sulfurtransferase FdhD [Paenarthrobacter aurescens]MCT9870482.1 formate dehydrogenase accessory sulfurtransferase FdhD [Paenarthrobacter aurescens]